MSHRNSMYFKRLPCSRHYFRHWELSENKDDCSRLCGMYISMTRPTLFWKFRIQYLQHPNLLEEPGIKLSTSTGSSKKQDNSRKTSIFPLLTMPQPLTVWITINCGKFLKRWEYQTTWPASWKTCMQVRKQQLELDLEQQTGFKVGKEYIKAVYRHPAYLTSAQSTSCKISGWMKHKLESRLPGEISITSDMQMTSYVWQKAKNY